MSSDLPTLIQLATSHRSEAARWVLDYKAIPHVRRSLLPGLHLPHAMALTGQTDLPVLLVGHRKYVMEDAVTAYAEEQVSERPLASDPTLVTRLSRQLAPAMDVLWHAAILDDRRFATAWFCYGRGPTRRRAYRAVYAGVQRGMKRALKLPGAVSEARGVLAKWLEQIAELSASTGFLRGDAFSEADIRAASYLSWLVPRPWFPYRLPDPVTEGVEQLRVEFGAHPAVVWATHIYRVHRGVSMAENHEAQGADVL